MTEYYTCKEGYLHAEGTVCPTKHKKSRELSQELLDKAADTIVREFSKDPKLPEHIKQRIIDNKEKIIQWYAEHRRKMTLKEFGDLIGGFTS